MVAYLLAKSSFPHTRLSRKNEGVFPPTIEETFLSLTLIGPS